MRGQLRRGGVLAIALAVLCLAASAGAQPAPSSAPMGPPLPPSAEPVPSAEPAASAEPAPSASAAPSARAAPSASAAPSALPEAVTTPAPSSSGATATAGDVKLQDSVVFTLLLPHGSQGLKERADGATAALKEALKTAKPEDVRVEQRGDAAVVYAGATPVVQLYAEDAAAAGAASLGDHAAAVAARIREGLRREQKRSAIAGTVFSFSLVVLLGLVVLYLVRRVAEIIERARNFVSEHPERVPAIRLYSLEVVRPAALRSALVVGLGAGRWFAQLALVYLWLLVTLSLFESTRGYTEKLTGLVLSPLSGLAARFASSLPILIVAAIAGAAVWLLLRFVAMFFTSVARRETKVAWLPAELAEPTSMLTRAAIVVATLVFAAPVITGDSEGALARTGTVLLGALGLACTPLLATVLAGAAVVYSRRLRAGTWAEIDGRIGRVRSVGLLEVRLGAPDGSEIRVPHLLCLVRATRVLDAGPRAQIELAVSADAKLSEVSELLEQAASEVGPGASVQIVDADAAGIAFRVSVASEAGDAPSRLRAAALEALANKGVRLGRRVTGAE